MTFLNNLYASFVIFCSNFNARFGHLINLVLILLFLALIFLLFWRTLRASLRVRHIRSELVLPAIEPERQQRYIQHLSEAIRIPTVTGDSRGLARLQELLQRQFPLVFSKFEVTRPQGGSLILRWKGADPQGRKPVLFCGHMDVVPTDGQEWKRDPFCGEVEEGVLHGRGALDCKNVVIGLMESAEELLEQGFTPGRDVYFAFGIDEETGGKQGAHAIAEYFLKKGISFEMILDEGSNITTSHLGNPKFPAALVGVAEKGSAVFRLTARTKAGHAAMPPQHTALGILCEAVCRVEGAPMHKRMLPVMRQCMTYSMPAMDFGSRAAVANLPYTSPLLFHFTRHNAQISSLFHTTFAATQASGSDAANVLPEEADATLNVRVLQGDTLESVQSYLEALLTDLPVTVELISGSEPSAVSETKGPCYDRLEATLKETFGSLAVIPAIMPAGTDTKHYTKLSDSIYRFMPFYTDPSTFAGIHAADESIRCDSFASGIRFYMGLIKKL